jgi:hypothetical protein
MKDKASFVRDCVITTVSDDFEDFKIVFRETKRMAASRKLKVSKEDVAEAIRRLIAEGYAEAYVLSTRSPHSRKVKYTRDRLHELWFYATPRGKRVAKSFAALGGKDV